MMGTANVSSEEARYAVWAAARAFMWGAAVFIEVLPTRHSPSIWDGYAGPARQQMSRQRQQRLRGLRRVLARPPRAIRYARRPYRQHGRGSLSQGAARAPAPLFRRWSG